MTEKSQSRVRSSDRSQQILLDLELRPYVRIGKFAQRFNVANEMERRDFDTPPNGDRIAYVHGAASVPVQRHFPCLDKRTYAQIEERERIGIGADELIQGAKRL